MKKKHHLVILDAGTIGDDIHWPDFATLDTSIQVFENTKPEEVASRIQKASLVLTNKVILEREHILNAPALAYIGTIATGYNQVDIAAAKERAIPVCNVPGYSTPAVVQHTFALLFALASRICLHANAVAEGEWSKSRHFCFWKKPLLELAGKTMGVVGFGNIGSGVARAAHGFGMHVLAYAPRPKPAPDYKPFSFVGIKELFARSDAISLNCPLTPDNEGMVNTTLLRTMKPNALLINCSRGQLINEADLLAALEQGLIAGAGLDVIREEPMRNNDPLRTAPNCLITPHIAWASVESRERLLRVVFDNVKNFLLHSPTNVVNT